MLQQHRHASEEIEHGSDVKTGHPVYKTISMELVYPGAQARQLVEGVEGEAGYNTKY